MGLDVLNVWYLLAIPLSLGWLWLVSRRRGGRGLKANVSAALRSCAVVLLSLALAGTSIVWRGRSAQLIVLADRSQSMQGKRAEQEEWIRGIERALPDHYTLSVVSFGADSQVEKSFEGAALGRLQAQVDDDGTDYEQSVRFASALFAQDAARQVLLLTDGLDNQGDVGQVTALLRAQGIRVDAHVFEQEEGDDAQVSRIEVPGTVYQGEKFDILVEIYSEVEKRADLLLYGGSALMSSQEVNLQKGTNRFAFQDVAQSTGLVDYRAVLQESGGVVQNNQKSTVAKVMGAPRVLVIEGAPGEAEELEKMLRATSIEPEVRQVGALPRTAAGMQAYDVVVFVNVNADDCAPEQLQSLEQFVRTLGRGFVLFGGDNSFALGSYIGSELEQMLPVESNVRNKLDIPSLAMVIAIDHSGSMAESTMGVTRLELAKESAQRAVEQLTPQDEVGVIAFDDTAKWVANLQSAENAQEIIGLIGGLRTGGGTMMYSSISEAYRALMGSGAAIKHLILLTDGYPADSGFEPLVAQMRDDHITVSAVAMGADANTGLMQRLSELGGGRFYAVDAGDNIPAIFAKETQLSTQSYLQDRVFYPEYAAASPLTNHFQSGMPLLTGFLATVEKPTATVALQSDNRLPILAHWQYGAGQVVAWTSDTRGVWSEDFLYWEHSAPFFGGFVANVLKGDSEQGYLELSEQGGRGKLELVVEGMDQTKTQATVIAPDGAEQQVSMHLEKPGVFTAQFPLDQEGVYAVLVEQSREGEVVNTLEGGLPRGYSAEYDRQRNTDHQAVAKLLDASGGERIDTPEQLFNRPLERAEQALDLTPLLVTLGLLLFLLDVTARRLQWEAKAQALLRLVATKLPKPAKAGRQSPSAGFGMPEAEEAPAVPEEEASKSAVRAKPKKEPKSPKGPKDSSMSGELLARRRNKK